MAVTRADRAPPATRDCGALALALASRDYDPMAGTARCADSHPHSPATQHVPGFHRLPQFELNSASVHAAAKRESEFQMGPKPFNIETKTILVEFEDDVVHVLPDKMRKTEAVVQGSSPTLQGAPVRALTPGSGVT